MRVLVIEDEIAIAKSIAQHLLEHGIQAEHAAEVVLAEYALKNQEFELVVLDLGLPNIDGIEILKRIRAKYSMPVIVLTARDSLESKVNAFNLGADDYMVKPFELDELLARIYALSRRKYVNTDIPTEIKIGKLRLVESERRIYVGLDHLDLSVREYSVLNLLMQKNSKVVSKRQLQEFLTKESSDDWITETAIEVYIHRVRKKIEDCNVIINTVRGFGYVLKQV
jgi:DNA-binding response OmpR family regulator